MSKAGAIKCYKENKIAAPSKQCHNIPLNFRGKSCDSSITLSARRRNQREPSQSDVFEHVCSPATRRSSDQNGRYDLSFYDSVQVRSFIHPSMVDSLSCGIGHTAVTLYHLFLIYLNVLYFWGDEVQQCLGATLPFQSHSLSTFDHNMSLHFIFKCVPNVSLKK